MSQSNHETKKEFQIERIILFTDAVFAIAITLLVIEIKAPHIHHGANSAEIVSQLLDLFPLFIGFLISFFVIAIYWRSHHRLFSFIKDYDEKLIFLNFIFLFTIVLMPFSAAYYSENTAYALPFYFYCINVAATGIVNFFMLNYIIKNHGRISDGFFNLKARKLARWRTLIVPGIFIVAMFLEWILPQQIKFYSRFMPVLIWPAMVVLRKVFGHNASIEFTQFPAQKK